MLFQWGIVEGNDPNIYSQTIKTYIQRGAVQRSGDLYQIQCGDMEYLMC